MNNENILKKVFPLLRENEQVLDIPKKCKWNFIIHFIIQLALIIGFLRSLIQNGNSNPLFVPCSIVLFVFILILCVTVASFLYHYIVITNQRLIVLFLNKKVCIKREKIKAITYEYFLERYFIINTIIKVNGYSSLLIGFYNPSEIAKKLGVKYGKY